ncbi:MAG: hypothetical protein KAG94_04370 [Clostridiales bacterium]|nr:hypothetical protein [Clostridiales bacterium]
MKKIIKKVKGYLANDRGFGLYEVIGIVAVLLVAAFVVIPGFRSFSEGILADLQSWFDTTISTSIFPVA